MKMDRKVRRLAAVWTAVCLLSGGCFGMYAAKAESGAAESIAPEIMVEDKGLALGESTLAYPSLTGLPEETAKALNDRILADTRVPEYLTRMSQLISGGALTVEWSGGVLGDVFSCVVSAEGAVETPRHTHVWTWSNLDLRDGHEIALDELFADPEGGRAAMESYLEEEVAPELSAHLGSSELLPLPEGFRLERTGLTLLYPIGRLSTLSDRAGAVRIGWQHLTEWLDLSPDGIPGRIGAADMLNLGPESREALEKMTASGRLTDVPAAVGDSMKALTDRHHLLMDPEVYEGGRLFSLEGAAFQNILVLTDYLSEDWENSTVQGLRAADGCFWGLRIGESTRTEWEAVLGEPDSRVRFEGEKAEYWRVEAGECDYYRFGSYQLQLYADTEGILRCLAVTE